MIVVGVDEVGRGCWAGPLVAGAVILPPGFQAADLPVRLRDSKKLSRLQRQTAAAFVRQNALAIGVGWVWPEEIDISGVTAAVALAMERAVAEIHIDYDELIVDGNFNFLADNPKSTAVIKADESVLAVSAASIIAKVARDHYMHEVSEKYPLYGFESHVGYGTAQHLSALQQYGVCELHRTSYKPIKRILALSASG